MFNIFNIPTSAASPELPHKFHDALFGASLQTRSSIRETIIPRTVQTILGEIPHELLRDEQAHVYTTGPQPTINHDQLARSAVKEMIAATDYTEFTAANAPDTTAQSVESIDPSPEQLHDNVAHLSRARMLVGSQFDQPEEYLDTNPAGSGNATDRIKYINDHPRGERVDTIVQESASMTSQPNISSMDTARTPVDSVDNMFGDMGYEQINTEFGMGRRDAA